MPENAKMGRRESLREDLQWLRAISRERRK